MWPIKEKEKKTAAHIVAKNIIPYSKLQKCVVTVLLLTSTPLVSPYIQTSFISGPK